MAVKSITVESRVGPDGILKLQVPVGIPNSDVVVIVVPVAPAKKPPEDLGWPPGFFEETAGAWKGETLVRAPLPFRTI